MRQIHSAKVVRPGRPSHPTKRDPPNDMKITRPSWTSTNKGRSAKGTEVEGFTGLDVDSTAA